MGKNNLIYLAVVVVVLIGLFYLLKPKTSSAPVPAPSSSGESTSSANASSAMSSNVKTFNLEVKDKKLTGETTLKATEGDEIIFSVASDISEELHLHGYDKHVDLEKGKTVQLKFTADKTGRFPFELEEDKIELGALEVQPK